MSLRAQQSCCARVAVAWTSRPVGANCRIFAITCALESDNQSTRPNWEGRPVRSSGYALGLALASGVKAVPALPNVSEGSYFS